MNKLRLRMSAKITSAMLAAAVMVAPTPVLAQTVELSTGGPFWDHPVVQVITEILLAPFVLAMALSGALY